MLDRLLETVPAEHWRFVVGSVVAAGAAITDAATDLQGWEDKGIKGLLVAAVLYLVRELAKQRTEDKAKAELREEKMAAALNKNSDALAAVVAATKEQTEYYQDVARQIIEAKMQNK